MAHGAPDDSNVVAVRAQERVDDMAELAVRLGSIASVDRWGRVAYQTNFEKGIGDWQNVDTGSQWGYLSCEGARSGGYCLHLGWDADAESPSKCIWLLLDYPLAGNVGVEAYIHPYFSGGWYALYGELYSGSRLYYYGIRWNGVTETIQVKDETGNYIDVLDVDYTYGFWRTWRCLKVVADTENERYKRGWWGPFSIDLSGISMKSIGSYVEPYSSINIKGQGLEGYPGEYKVDDVILTVYEP